MPAHGRAISQRIHKRIERAYGWAKAAAESTILVRIPIKPAGHSD
jgi:hypothetical protein